MPLALGLSFSISRGSRDKVGRKEGILEADHERNFEDGKESRFQLSWSYFCRHSYRADINSQLGSFSDQVAGIHSYRLLSSCDPTMWSMSDRLVKGTPASIGGVASGKLPGRLYKCQKLIVAPSMQQCHCSRELRLPTQSEWLLPTLSVLEGTHLGCASGLKMASDITAAATLSPGSKLANRLLGEPDPER